MSTQTLASRRDVLRLAASSSLAMLAGAAQAQGAGWPTKPVTLIVPFPAGGGTDAFARPLTAALTDAEVCIFTRAAFDGFAKEHPDLQHKLLQRTLDELDRARQWMMLLGRKTASERIATLLLEMSNRLGSNGCSAIAPFLNEFDLPMDRQQMGDVLGLTIETVSRQLTKLKDAEMIELPDRRRVVIKDRRRLEQLADAA